MDRLYLVNAHLNHSHQGFKPLNFLFRKLVTLVEHCYKAITLIIY